MNLAHKYVTVFLFFLLALTASASERKNVLLICVDDLRPELNCYGVDYIHSPNIDQLAANGRAFHNHYVNAPTCGASRYTLLTGQYNVDTPQSNRLLFIRANKLKENPSSVSPSLPAWFRNNGYTTVSIGKVSHHPGGLGGKNWDDPNIVEMPNSWDLSLQPIGDWQHPKGVMHALAEGKIWGSGEILSVFEAFAGNDQIYPDGLITEKAIEQLDKLDASGSPFFMAVGFIRPHLPFGAPKKYLDLYSECELPAIAHPCKPKHPSSWQSSGEFMRYNRWSRNPISDPAFADEVRRHYAACVSYIDTQVGILIEQLERSGMLENTVVVLWGDHGWHLGEHGVWGKHTLFEESLRSPLIISHKDIPNSGEPSEAIVESIDIFPTLCDISGIPIPGYIHGKTLKLQLDNPESLGHSAIGFQTYRKTIRTENHRLILHNNGYAELYDFSNAKYAGINRAQDFPNIVLQLTEQLTERLKLNK